MRGSVTRFARHFALLCIPGLLASLNGPAGSHVARASAQDRRLESAVEVLSHIPTGRQLLARAQLFWGLRRPGDVIQKLKWGTASKTDAVLTRHFNPRTGQESRERQVTIFVRKAQPLDDLVLDIAHELVHATVRPAWDPYDPELTAGRYIWSAIEGEGGEVRAVALECQVGFEINERFGAAAQASRRCKNYLRKGEKRAEASAEVALDDALIRKDFYRVGHWGRELSKKLGTERDLFPLLSRESPKLYSSTGNAPYPVALYQEFEEITQIACENSRKRVNADSSRAPAALQKNAESFVAQRCTKRSS